MGKGREKIILENRKSFLSIFCFVLCSNSSTKEKPYVYVYSNGDEQRTYYPVNGCLQEIGKNLQSATKKPWEIYLKEGLMHLQVNHFKWNETKKIPQPANETHSIVDFLGTNRKRFYPTSRKHR